jgi:hypothetical protein
MTKKVVTKKNQVRHTHATINGIEDAQANLISLIQQAEIVLLKAKQALGILQATRQSPHSYQRGKAKEAKITFIRDDDDDK